MIDLGYDIDGWDRWLSLGFYVAMLVLLARRFHIATPVDEEH